MNQTPVTYAEFIEWYPEFADVPQPAVERQLKRADCLLSPDTLGCWWREACALWAAHYLALRYNISAALAQNGLQDPTGTVGIVNNKSANVSGLSESKTLSGLITSDDPFKSDLARTEYGTELLSLIEMVVSPVDVVYSADASETIQGLNRAPR